MDYLAEAQAVLAIIEQLYSTAANLVAASKAAGDPTPAELTQQMADSSAANARVHALVNGA